MIRFLQPLAIGPCPLFLRGLLGELPDSQKSWDFLGPNGTQRRRRSRVNSDCTTRTENTDASMDLFKRPNYAGSDVFSEPSPGSSLIYFVGSLLLSLKKWVFVDVSS